MVRMYEIYVCNDCMYVMCVCVVCMLRTHVTFVVHVGVVCMDCVCVLGL